ncbi:DUF3311 domain-containing protein [Catellatospora methionotrophica]|uniref:DUF3311 domain-containing protein n=1 Tax=Catellatospora methionotrophica TaxID=121620 RepID=UPI0033F18EFB
MGEPTPDRRPGDRDHSPWNWLLIVPIVLPLITTFYNASSPDLLGFPRFYWQQLAYILVGVSTTTLVYRMTKRRAVAPRIPASRGHGEG